MKTAERHAEIATARFVSQSFSQRGRAAMKRALAGLFNTIEAQYLKGYALVIVRRRSISGLWVLSGRRDPIEFYCGGCYLEWQRHLLLES